MQVELTSKHYRRFPLVKGGMEIACLVRVRIPATLKNTKLAEKYLEKYAEKCLSEIDTPSQRMTKLLVVL